VRSFLGVFPTDMLPRFFTQSGTIIINADLHTEKGSHWLAVHFLPKSSSAYFFNSYCIVPLDPDIEAFIRRNYTVSDYNRRQLHGVTSNICCKYCCLFALYMGRGFTAKEFVSNLTVRRQQFDRSFRPSLPNSGRCVAITAAVAVADNASPAFYER